MLTGFDIAHARGFVSRVPVVLPHIPIGAGAVVSMFPVLALLLGELFVPMGWNAALIFFRPLGLMVSTVQVVASPQGRFGLSLLSFFSAISASGRGLASARPGGVPCPLGSVDAVRVAAGGGSGGGRIF